MAEPKPFRPKQFPPPEFMPRRKPIFSRMPPAVFPVLMGLLGLGLALRRGFDQLGLPNEVAELVLGAACGLWSFAALAYLSKLARRFGTLAEDLRTLPGRAGTAAGSLGLLLVASAVVPYSHGLATGLMVAGLVLHGALALLMLNTFRNGPPEQREVTPVWHLHFVGFILAGLSAVPLGYGGLATTILWGTMAIAGVIWGISLMQLIRRIPPAPLRPLLAIHLAPASLFATVAALLQLNDIALFFAVVGGVILLALVMASGWIATAGFSPLWGAFTFPIAAYASALLALDMVATGVVVLIAAIGLIPPILYRVLAGWAKGDLAAKTNAAQA